MRNSNKRARRAKFEKGVVTTSVVAIATVIWFILQVVEVEAKVSAVPEVEVLPIQEVPKEMDWDKFTSIYEEDLKTVKAEEVAKKKTKSQKVYSESDVMLLARLMHAEEGILLKKLSPEDAKRAHMLAGSVALHRLEQKYLGAETLTEVIYSHGQYASVEKLNQKVPEETIQWAQELIDNGPIGPSNMIFQAEFEQGTDTYDHIGNQFFCCK